MKQEKAFRRETVVTTSLVAEDVVEISISWSGQVPYAGQFFMLHPVRSGVLLPRAISVCDVDTHGLLHFLIALRGTGSREFGDLRPGECIELTGPLGNTWQYYTDTNMSDSGTTNTVQKTDDAAPDAASSEDSSTTNKPALARLALIGGGVGIAPLVFLAKQLAPYSFDFYAGFRSKPFGIENLHSRNTVIATEDGSAGKLGMIPEFFDARHYTTVYACGPEPMLEAIARACSEASVPCYLSMERRMACGVGACLGCTIQTIHGNRRCCVDGPIFPATEVLFHG